jgi:hypothetical protein
MDYFTYSNFYLNSPGTVVISHVSWLSIKGQRRNCVAESASSDYNSGYNLFVGSVFTKFCPSRSSDDYFASGTKLGTIVFRRWGLRLETLVQYQETISQLTSRAKTQGSRGFGLVFFKRAVGQVATTFAA